MPSKGVQVWSYIATPSPVEIEISVPGYSTVYRDKSAFRVESFEVEASAIRWPLRRTGRFEFVIRRNGHELMRQWMDVDPITGAIMEDSPMDDLLLETRSVTREDLVICYGVYRAGPGQFGLPNQHQCYIVVTQNFSTWQADVAPRGSPQADKPFNHMVLPAPHDPGMYTMQTVNAILSNAGVAGAKALIDVLPSGFQSATPVLQSLISGVSDNTVARLAPDIIASLAITQKDSISMLCTIGARYFEFRPAHCHQLVLPHIPFYDRLLFHHGPIPGVGYNDFLNQTVQFLMTHPDEIIVVHVRWDGVPNECRRPDDNELRQYLDDALRQTNGELLAGTLDDMRNATIRQLREQKKRLLIVINAGDVLSTYDDVANATLDGGSILQAFERVLEPGQQEGRCITVAQCQATPTMIADVLKYSIATADVSSLLLMATKSRCGHLMLPWVRQNVAGRCRKDRLMVLMDDFLDGSTTDVAVGLTRQRLA